MKKVLLLIFIAFSLSGKTQTITLNTFYMIPPTSGCNGVWALDISPAQGPCGPCANYLSNPCWDAFATVFSGDTMFLALCSLPCNFMCVTLNACTLICSIALTNVQSEYNAGDVATLFPNPATNQLTISSRQWAIKEIEIYDVVGEKVFSQSQTSNLKPQTTIDVSELAAGIYFVCMRGEKMNAVAKFVKQ